MYNCAAQCCCMYRFGGEELASMCLLFQGIVVLYVQVVFEALWCYTWSLWRCLGMRFSWVMFGINLLLCLVAGQESLLSVSVLVIVTVRVVLCMCACCWVRVSRCRDDHDREWWHWMTSVHKSGYLKSVITLEPHGIMAAVCVVVQTLPFLCKAEY